MAEIHQQPREPRAGAAAQERSGTRQHKDMATLESGQPTLPHQPWHTQPQLHIDPHHRETWQRTRAHAATLRRVVNRTTRPTESLATLRRGCQGSAIHGNKNKCSARTKQRKRCGRTVTETTHRGNTAAPSLNPASGLQTQHRDACQRRARDTTRKNRLPASGAQAASAGSQREHPWAWKSNAT
jgi:hypothetical protein